METGKTNRSNKATETGKPFRVEFQNAREAMGLSKRDAADELGTTSRTLRGWESGAVTPSRMLQVLVIERLQNSRRRPKLSKRNALRRSHHLHWEENRGWVLRFTLELNRKLVGHRRKIRLRTFNLEEAIARREILVNEYRRLGFTVSDRRHRKRKQIEQNDTPKGPDPRIDGKPTD